MLLKNVFMKKQMKASLTCNKRQFIINGFFLVGLIFVLHCNAISQTSFGRIVSFDFSNTNGMLTTKGSQFNNTTFVDTSTIVRSASLAAPKNNILNGNFIVNNYFASVGWVATSEAQAVSMNSYVQFNIQPKVGYEFRVDSILMRWRSSLTGVTHLFIRSSKDNYSATIASGMVVRGSAGILKLGLTSLIVSDSNLIFRIYAYGAEANQNFAFGETPINVSMPDIDVRGRMAISEPTAFIQSGNNADTICQGSAYWIKHIITHGTPPYKVYMHDGSGQQYRIDYLNEIDSTAIYPESSWLYTIDSVIDANGNKASVTSGSAMAQVKESNVLSALGNFSKTHSMSDGAIRTFTFDAQCGGWLKINDSVNGIGLGSVSSELQNASANFLNSTSRYFLPRKISIAANQPDNGMLTFYYTQSEFDMFNSQTNYHLKMPLNILDSLNYKSNILVARTTGSKETADLTLIAPQSVLWNSYKSCWEVRCNVNGPIMNGDYYITSNFTSSKMAGAISHNSIIPINGATSASVTFDWPDVLGVTQYRFRYRPVGQSTWSVSTVTGSSRLVNYLLFNTMYEVQVRVYEGPLLQGEYTPSYVFTTPLAPNKLPSCNKPITHVNVINSSTVEIQWNAVDFAQQYQIQIRPLNNLNWGGTSTNQTQIIFNSLTPNTTYEYKVRTQCEVGATEQSFSDFSTIDTFTTPNLLFCTAPLNLNNVTIGSSMAVLHWNNSNYATDYNVQLRIKNSGTWGGTSTSDSFFAFNGLLPATTYECRVRAVCLGGVTSTTSSDFTPVHEFTTMPIQLGACLPPSQIIASPTVNGFTLSWNAAPNASIYFIQYKPSAIPTWGGGSTTNTQYHITNLIPNTTYQYRIRTTCELGTTYTPLSLFSSIENVTTSCNRDVIPAHSDGVFPNPTTGDLNLTRIDQSSVIYHVVVMDMFGRMVKKSIVHLPPGTANWQYSLSGYIPGFYLMHVYADDGNKKVFKIQLL